MARTKEQRIADRAAARVASGQSMSNRQVKNAAGLTARPSSRPPSRPPSRPSSGPRPAPRPSAPAPRPPSRPSSSPSRGWSGTSSASSAKAKAQTARRDPSRISVADRRAAAAKAGIGLRDYKAGVAAGHYNHNGRMTEAGKLHRASLAGAGPKAPGAPAPPPSTGGTSLTDKYGSGLKGFASWWNAEGKQARIDNEMEYRKNNPNSGMVNGWSKFHDIELTENGYFNWDSSKPVNGLDVAKMKEFGIKGGDQVFDPAAFKSVNNGQNDNHMATTNGRLDAHYYAEGIAMPLDTAQEGRMREHNAQMQRNQWQANADGSKLGDANGLFQDKYAVGYHGSHDTGKNYVGSHHGENVTHARGNNIREKIDNYVRDGGYAGDGLKMLEGHKQNLKSENDIKWYNGLIQQARNYDWSKADARYSQSAGGSYDVRAGGLASQYR